MCKYISKHFWAVKFNVCVINYNFLDIFFIISWVLACFLIVNFGDIAKKQNYKGNAEIVAIVMNKFWIFMLHVGWIG